MEKKFLMVVALLWAVVFTSCSDKDDNTDTRSQKEMEESIIGLWQEEFEYKDVTEDGKPFNRALIVVETKADHTGYVALQCLMTNSTSRLRFMVVRRMHRLHGR